MQEQTQRNHHHGTNNCHSDQNRGTACQRSQNRDCKRNNNQDAQRRAQRPRQSPQAARIVSLHTGTLNPKNTPVKP